MFGFKEIVKIGIGHQQSIQGIITTNLTGAIRLECSISLMLLKVNILSTYVLNSFGKYKSLSLGKEKLQVVHGSTSAVSKIASARTGKADEIKWTQDELPNH